MLLRDVALAAALAVGSLVPVFSVPNEPLMWRAIGWSLLMCASVALRRVTPLGALAVIAVAGMGMVFTETGTYTPAIIGASAFLFAVVPFALFAGRRARS